MNSKFKKNKTSIPIPIKKVEEVEEIEDKPEETIIDGEILDNDK